MALLLPLLVKNREFPFESIFPWYTVVQQKNTSGVTVLTINEPGKVTKFIYYATADGTKMSRKHFIIGSVAEQAMIVLLFITFIVVTTKHKVCYGLTPIMTLSTESVYVIRV